MTPLGYLQRHMLEFCQRYPGRHYISPDCGTTCLMVSANSEPDRREAEQ